MDKAEYRNNHYLLFGSESSHVYDQLDCDQTAEYLLEMGFSDNALTQARKLKGQAGLYASYRDPDAHYCDFCGRLLTGVEWDVLKDGRERCVECSESVVNSKQDFETLLVQVRDGLCMKFSIDLPSPVPVKVVSQKKMSAMQGSRFVPTKYFDARAVGLAVHKGAGYQMFFENGSPRGALVATTAHELTHIWQYSHWNWKAMEARYGERFLAVAEGMAKWVEIQYLYLLNEVEFAKRSLEHETSRTDVYGYGLRLFLNQYPISRGIILKGDTPFMHPTEPLEV